MIDFQALHARQLEIYQDYSRFKRASVHYVRLSQLRLSSIKRNSLNVQRSLLEPSIKLPEGMSGQQVNLLI